MARNRSQPRRHVGYRDDTSLMSRIITVPRLCLLVVFVLAVGFLLGAKVGDKAEAAPIKETNQASAERGPGPYRYDGDVPVGYSHDEKGAIAAASAFISVPPQLLLRSTDDAAVAVTKLSTLEDAQRLSLQMQQAYDTVRLGIATAQQTVENPRFFLQLVPVGNEVLFSGKTRMTVKLWVLETSAVEGLVNPVYAWETHTLSLRWQRNDWKIENWASSAGPTPAWIATPATPVSEFLTLVEKMRPYKYQAK